RRRPRLGIPPRSLTGPSDWPIPSSGPGSVPIIHRRGSPRRRATMSSAGITFGGLASGLDTKAIITALMAVERQPITALEDKKTELTKEKGLFGDLGGLLDTLQTAAQRLAHTTDFLTMKATASDTLLSATATRTARAGTHDVVVQSLAASQISRSNGFATKDAAIVSGCGTIFLNGPATPVHDPGNTSLHP